MTYLKIILSLIILSNSTLAQNVKVEDYKVPVSSAKTLRFNGTYNWGQTSDDSLTTVTANNAAGSFLFRSFYSSLPYAWFIDVDASGAKNFDEYSYDIKISPSMRKYLI